MDKIILNETKQLTLLDFNALAEEIKTLTKSILDNRWKIAEKLFYIKNNWDEYKKQDDFLYKTFQQFIKDYYGWTKKEAYNYLDAHKLKLLLADKSVVNYTLDDVGITNADLLYQLSEIDEDKAIEIVKETPKITQKELKEKIKEVKRKIKEGIRTPELPIEKYNVIYADPPWDIGSIELEKWGSPLSEKYPTMSLDAIKNLKIDELSNEDCSLFLWATHTTLKDAFDVMENWGFKYHCCITWDKGNGWSANGFHRRTEFCLYGYKGNINVNQKGNFIPTLVIEKKRKHSQKPDIMRKLLISNTPKPRIELFAREKIDDEFDVWGNEVNGNN